MKKVRMGKWGCLSIGIKPDMRCRGRTGRKGPASRNKVMDKEIVLMKFA